MPITTHARYLPIYTNPSQSNKNNVTLKLNINIFLKAAFFANRTCIQLGGENTVKPAHEDDSHSEGRRSLTVSGYSIQVESNSGIRNKDYLH